LDKEVGELQALAWKKNISGSMALNLALNLEKKYIRVYGFESLAINTHLKQSLHMIERTIYQGLHICN